MPKCEVGVAEDEDLVEGGFEGETVAFWSRFGGESPGKGVEVELEVGRSVCVLRRETGAELTMRQRRSGESVDAPVAGILRCSLGSGVELGESREEREGGQEPTERLPPSLPSTTNVSAPLSSAMRQRKAPASGAPRPAAASAAQGGKRSSPALPVFTRLRILLLSLPLLLGWYIIFQRRSTARPLPTSFAICSHHSGPPQIHTMDASNSLASCVVVDHGKIKDVGSLEKVRKVWGDVDMRGSSSGIKIAYLKKGQMLTPGL